jgi:hypothetical protein
MTCTQATIAPSNGWTALPQDVVQAISIHFTPSELSIVRLVCSEWAAVTSTLLPQVTIPIRALQHPKAQRHLQQLAKRFRRLARIYLLYTDSWCDPMLSRLNLEPLVFSCTFHNKLTPLMAVNTPASLWFTMPRSPGGPGAPLSCPSSLSSRRWSSASILRYGPGARWMRSFLPCRWGSSAAVDVDVAAGQPGTCSVLPRVAVCCCVAACMHKACHVLPCGRSHAPAHRPPPNHPHVTHIPTPPRHHLQGISRLTQLRQLLLRKYALPCLGDQCLSGRHVALLQPLTKLRSLQLGCASLDGPAFEALCRLTGLTGLSLLGQLALPLQVGGCHKRMLAVLL